MSKERRDPGRERFDDLKETYALGALDEDECLWFEAYLTAHPELQAEVDDLGAVAALLALAPQEHEPHPELRRDLLNRIGTANGTTQYAEAPPRRAWLTFPGGLAAAITAVVLLAVAGLSIWNVSLRTENEDLRGEVQSRQTYELEGSGAARDVQGEVVELGEGRAILVAENLPPAPEGEVYQAWLMHDGGYEPAGFLEPDEGAAATPIEGPLEDADSVAVTVEPSGGSSTPSEILLTADL